MKKNIYRASVFFGIIGLTLIYFSTLYLEAEESSIGSIERDQAGSHVKIEGKVVSLFESDNHKFFDLNDSTGEISVVDFDSEQEINQGDEVLVKGRVDIYQGDLQVISDILEVSD